MTGDRIVVPNCCTGDIVGDGPIVVSPWGITVENSGTLVVTDPSLASVVRLNTLSQTESEKRNGDTIENSRKQFLLAHINMERLKLANTTEKLFSIVAFLDPDSEEIEFVQQLITKVQTRDKMLELLIRRIDERE